MMDLLSKPVKEMTNDEISTVMGLAQTYRFTELILQLQEEQRNRGIENDEYSNYSRALGFLTKKAMSDLE